MIAENKIIEILNQIKEENKDDVFFSGIRYDGSYGEKVLIRVQSKFVESQFRRRGHLELIQKRIREKSDKKVLVELTV